MKKPEYRSIIILAHILTTVPAQDLEEYFIKEKIENLLFIGHPLFYKKGRPGPQLRLYKKGVLIKEISHSNRHLPSIVQYIKDFFLTLWWVFKIGKKWDIIIALDNLNALSGLTLRKLRRVKKVIYYTIDFVPQRFANNTLNNLYHSIDAFCIKHVDLTWNISPRIAEGREVVRNLQKKDFPHQTSFPVGVWLNRIQIIPFEKKKKHTIVYAGGLLPHQGVQSIITALPLIKKSIPGIKLVIMGIGSYEQTLKKLVTKLKLTKQVSFLGYMEKHEDVEKILSTCGVAVALYSKKLDKWSYYADPSKIKTYLAAGLPVITTDLTYIAKDLESKKCGIIVSEDAEAIANGIVSLVSDAQKHKKYTKNALSFIKEFDWNTIIPRGIDALYDKKLWS